jgi:hypothetical protein
VTTIHEVAAKLAELVEENLPPSPAVSTRDINDELLCAAFGRCALLQGYGVSAAHRAALTSGVKGNSAVTPWCVPSG